MNEYVDITAFGDSEPQYIECGWTPAQLERAKLKARADASRQAYIAGAITLEQFEADLDHYLAS